MRGPMMIIGYTVTSESLDEFAHEVECPLTDIVGLGNALTERLDTKIVVARALEKQRLNHKCFYLIPGGFDIPIDPTMTDRLLLYKEFQEKVAHVPRGFKQLPKLLWLLEPDLNYFIVGGENTEVRLSTDGEDGDEHDCVTKLRFLSM
ncbi:hypothetical protein DACRYDRAFT_104340 [Dacryopinax primogenitus]|uniref:Uncharacterized protein n=1 Tax=Dacryopinax primogenitus (strain DJM 731) TaxID=1858805 RepID=M5GEZ8_DACPD|nr:uncharacterized protein DACRYDRAFT_104340 [Dacryopinax primogenitus]EJU05852.1 hypothetical protein DACRYDRAFT_104340 [Dacryopinax primogenitus]